MSKLVSICIPTFNSSETIAETLESLVRQTYSNFKIIIFDNHSTDNTLEVVEEFRSKFKHFEIVTSEKNLGAEGNFTRCLQYSDSDYSAIYHADDIYEENIITSQVLALDSHKDLLAVSTHANEINGAGDIIGQRFIPQELDNIDTSIFDFDELLELTLKYGNIITCPSVMARTEVYSNHIKIWDGVNYKSSADLDVWLRISKLGKFGFINKALINYRVAEVSTSFRMKQFRVLRHDMFLVIDEYFDRKQRNDLASYYDFLILKDNALRVYNNSGEDLSISNASYLLTALHSRWHFSFFVKILVIWLLKKLKLRR